MRRAASLFAVAGFVTIGLASAHAAATVSVDCATDPSALQSAIDVAAPGDILNVTGTCVGTFTIDKDLTLQGTGTLDGNHQGTVLRIAAEAHVIVTDLTITNGVHNLTNHCVFVDSGGGIVNFGMLTLGGSARAASSSACARP